MDPLQNQLFEVIFNQSSSPIVIVKADVPHFTILTCNKQYEITTNATGPDLIGKRTFEILQQQYGNLHQFYLLKTALIQSIETKQKLNPAVFCFDVLDSNGEIIDKSYWQIEIVPIQNADESVEYLMCTTHDVTRQELNHRAVEQSKQREQLLNEKLQLTIEDLAATNEELLTTNEELITSNEELIQSQHNLQMLNSELEEHVNIRTKSLTESESRIRSIFDQVPFGMCLLSGQQMIIELANNNMLDIWGETKDVIGKQHRKARPELGEQPLRKIMEEVYTSGITYKGKEIEAFRFRFGKQLWGYFNIVYQPIKHENGATASLLVIIEDVTEQVKAKQSLEKIYEQSNLAKQAAQLGMFDWNLLKHSFEWDERSRELFGISHDQPVNFDDDFLGGIHPDDQARVRYEINRSFDKASTNGDYDIEYRTIGAEDRKLRWIRARGKAQFDKQNKPVRFIGTIQEVTKDVIAKKEQERTEEMLRTAIESAELGTWYIDAVTREFIPSPRLKELFGFYPDEQMSYQAAIKQVTDDHREKVAKAIEEAISQGKKFELEYSINGYHDQKLRWVRATGKLYKEESGKPMNFSGTLLDITERKLDDIRKNDFIAIVSHELKTPLTSLKAYVQMLASRTKKIEDPFTSNALDKANTQVNKMTDLINSFLNVSRLESGKIHLDKTDFDMEQLIQETVTEVALTMEHYKIKFLPCEPLTVNADHEKIEQVLNNLLSNAIKYSPNGNQIEISCHKLGNHAEVRVKDEGIGISQQDLTKLFERFYRVENKQTKTISGFGIGLYLCAEIIQRHNGKIWAESEFGKGSTFYFNIPLT